jgi:mono/diheme cytochrome c family protein
MRRIWQVTCVVALHVAVLATQFPAAQGSPSPRPGRPETDQQKSGEALFRDNCALCHVHSATKKRLGTTAATELIGLFKKPSVTEASVRRFVLDGLPGQMPSFTHYMTPGELDDLIAYLKIR